MLSLRQTAVACLIFWLRIDCFDASGAAQQTAPDPDLALLQRFVDECVLIAPGTEPFPKQFQIGSKDDPENALPPRDVVMPIRFRMCRFEMTQELFESVMQRNPSRWKGLRNSVESITLSEAEDCCLRLTAALHTAKLIAPGEIVRLPTEIEWEYCCRAGTTTKYSFGDSATVDGDKDNRASVLSDYAWHTGNAAGNDPAVGSLKPNPWELYDMHGYLWEFVAEPNPPGSPARERTSDKNTKTTSPTDETLNSEATCIIRGGSWQDHHSALTSASRSSIQVSKRSDAIGFRCVIADPSEAR